MNLTRLPFDHMVLTTNTPFAVPRRIDARTRQRERCLTSRGGGRGGCSRPSSSLTTSDSRSRVAVVWNRLRISTSAVEGTVNRLIGRRMCKSQHMCWSKRGAHPLLQVRCAVLNGDLLAAFVAGFQPSGSVESCCPGFGYPSNRNGSKRQPQHLPRRPWRPIQRLNRSRRRAPVQREVKRSMS
jgi:hypothetical protein